MSYSNEELKAYAQTVLDQMGGAGKISAMIGVKHFGFTEKAGKMLLAIRFKAQAKNKANYVEIILDGNDTYTMEFKSIRGTSIKSKGKFEGLYCDMLKPTFESETHLYLSFN